MLYDAAWGNVINILFWEQCSYYISLLCVLSLATYYDTIILICGRTSVFS